MSIVVFLIIFGIILSSYIYINVTYKKYSKTKLVKSMNGFEVARTIIDSYDLNNIYITESKDILYSTYDGKRKVIRLIDDVFNDNSLTSCTISAVQGAKAILDKKKDNLFTFKQELEQFVNILLYIGYLIILIGIIFGHLPTIWIGVGVELVILFYHLCTIKVDIDTRNIAYTELINHDIIDKKEAKHIRELLKATLLMSVASIIFPFAELIKRIIIFGNSNK